MSTPTLPQNEPVDGQAPVLIVGAGLAGLACARALQQASVPFVVFEESDRVGGRVATDQVDGFQLDRGFQVLLTAYPEASRVYDYNAMDLRPFCPGALIQMGTRRYRFVDPWRKPLSAITTMLAPVARLRDVWGLVQLRRDALRHTDVIARDHEQSTIAYVINHGQRPWL